MKLLVFGQSGQVAQELARSLPQGWSADFFGRSRLDAADEAAVMALADVVEADAVVNAAAYTNVDGAEKDRPGAHALNAAAPGHMARLAQRLDAAFIHLSTDYVFSGESRTPYAPDDEPGPINVYGETKLTGERAVINSGGNALILRTSWVFSPFGSNFVKTMDRLSRERDRLRVVSDQHGGPTSARAIAKACIQAAMHLRDHKPGLHLHHFSGAPTVSWADFAEAVVELNGTRIPVERISTDEFPTAAARPKNSALDCSKLFSAFGIAQPDWRADLQDTLRDIGNAGAERET